MKLFEWYLNVMHGWHFDKALSNEEIVVIWVVSIVLNRIDSFLGEISNWTT